MSAEPAQVPATPRPECPGRRLWSSLAVACLLLFFIDLFLVKSGAARSWDRSIELQVFHMVGFRSFGLFDAISTAGTLLVRGAVVVVVVLALHVRRQQHTAGVLVGAVVGGELLNALAKTVVARPRPHLFYQAESAAGYAFPSGHAMSAIIFFGALSYVVYLVTGRPRLTVVAAAVGAAGTGLIGLARIALGVHYPTDVLGGYALGAAWLFLVITVSARRLRPPDNGRALPGPFRSHR